MRLNILPLFAVLLFVSFFADSASAQRAAVPKAGLWQVTAKDDQGTRWYAFMRLKRNNIGKLPARYSGYFDWRSSDGKTSGRELFTGSFSRRTGKLSFKAHKAIFYRGEIGVGNYSSRPSRNGTRLSGRWSGANVVPGKWDARWIKY